MLATVVAVLVFAGWLRYYFHWNVSVVPEKFEESSRSLENPNRGFYYIYGFYIKDEQTDYVQQVQEKFEKDTETKLSMIQINLQEYRDRPITEEGLANIRALFEALKKIDKHWIVRFLYDWHGENEEKEPEKIDIILTHMEQVGDILREYHNQIFTLQGLFIGNWGEMNGTRYTDRESMRLLAEQLAEVTDDTMYLSVRMPAQWRKITGTEDVFGGGAFTGRLGLFNDGMMGNESDYGTYGSESKENTFAPWSREEELDFQEKLCAHVPNGGEIIVDNPYNDFENAVRDLRTMHVTYLNEDYDKNVLDKWARTKIQTEDSFDGMNGLEYIGRHLGYRLLIQNVAMAHNFKEDTVRVEIGLQNKGFAPAYKECRAMLAVRRVDADSDEKSVWQKIRMRLNRNDSPEVNVIELSGDIRELAGGNDADDVLTFSAELPFRGASGAVYEVYFYLEDAISQTHIELANEQREEALGYLIGTIYLDAQKTDNE